MDKKRNSVEVAQLLKGQKYYFDDYSKAYGRFEGIKENGNNTVSIQFVPIELGAYSLTNGLVQFRFEVGHVDSFFKYKN